MYRKIVFILVTFFALVPLLATASTCPNPSRNLSFGSRGSDVVELQTFLIAEGDLAAGNNTGYFGRMTETAVKSWQAKNGLVSSGTAATTGYGAVGPRTRAKIASVCGTQAAQLHAVATINTISDLPGLAAAQNDARYILISVTVTTAPADGLYSIDWGDGTSGPLNHEGCSQPNNIGSNSGNGWCSSTLYSGGHAYKKAGTFKLRILDDDSKELTSREITAPAGSSGLKPRIPATKMNLQQLLAMPANQRLTLKFQEGLRVRMANGQLTGLSSEQSALFAGVLNSFGVSTAAVQRSYSRPEADLDAEREKGQQMSGNHLADANLYYSLQVPQGVSSAYVANALNALSFIEFAEPAPVATTLPSAM